MTSRRSLTSFLASWSLSNVILLNTWTEFLRADDPSYSYWMTRLAPFHFGALMFLALAAGAVGAAAAAASHSHRRPVRWAGIAVLAIGAAYLINEVRRLFVSALADTGDITIAPHPAWSIGVVLAITVPAWLLWKKAGVTPRRLARTAGLVLVPFLIFTHLSAARLVFGGELRKLDPVPRDTQPAGGRTTRGRVVVVVFDELDYGITFPNRPVSLRLPNFDRLRDESLFAVNAFPPGSYTHQSLLSYLLGRQTGPPEPVSPNDARLTFDSTGSSLLSKEQNLFDAARQLGATRGLVGWSLPYCRYPGFRLNACAARGDRTLPDSFLGTTAWLLAETLTVGPLLDRAYGVGLPYHTFDFLAMREAAEKMAAAGDLDLVWLHLAVPHLPRMYDMRTGKLVGPERVRWDAHFDNLVLADITLGRLRAAIERSGRSAETTLIVTSDHPFRFRERVGYKRDARIPLLIRLPYAAAPSEFADSVNTVGIGEVALQLLRGERLQPADIPRILENWARARRGFAASE